MLMPIFSRSPDVKCVPFLAPRSLPAKLASRVYELTILHSRQQTTLPRQKKITQDLMPSIMLLSDWLGYPRM